MKYIVLLGDGMADTPISALGGRTPLQAAFTPNMDKLAKLGMRGMVNTVPRGFGAGSDVANMSILGYDPAQYYSGRAPLEAASMGVPLKSDDVAFRCNLVTLGFDKERTRAFMEDYSAGHISSRNAEDLIIQLTRNLSGPQVSFHPGISYRHLMVWHGGRDDVICTPPHDIIGKEIADYLPTGEGSEFLNDLMRKSMGVLKASKYNALCMKKGTKPANSIWLWGQGRTPQLPLFREIFGLSGGMISAVDLCKGLATCAGLEVINVPGATGYLDTNYTGKAEYALKALKRLDFVYIHVEAADEAGHNGNYLDKIKAIEDFDSKVVGTILAGARKLGDVRILLLPDHPTPVELRTHTEEPVPFVIYDSTAPQDNGDAKYSEDIRRIRGAMKFHEGHKLMQFFVGG